MFRGRVTCPLWVWRLSMVAPLPKTPLLHVGVLVPLSKLQLINIYMFVSGDPKL
jgi:hypothetical protein